MKAVGIKGGKGPAEGMFIEEVPKPEVKNGQALIKVYSFGINRMDLIQRSSNYPLPEGASPILGVEFSGVIEELGQGAESAPNGTSTPGFAVGDKVCGLVPGGAYAEYVLCDYRTLMKMPYGLSFNEAAAIPENWFTAYQVVKLVGSFQKRDKVLIHGGASGIGVAVIQLAQLLGCRRVFATVGSDSKKQFIKDKLVLHAALGDEVVPINYRTEDWEEVIKKYDPKGIQLAIDTVGGDYIPKEMEVLGVDGRLVIMGLMSGKLSGSISTQQILYKRLRIEGTTLRARSPQYQQVLRDFVSETILPRVAQGKLRAIVDKVFPLEEVASAHKYMEANSNTGKIIVTVVDIPFDEAASG
ncbi:Quinone oxidoreductase PIG3 [Wickerhamiella sorbophila]|uniref:Quinone oxidoreductase PIG3 n=1 Tax=Wickerhamiella sorbophila TaxID=45607 RepID=A0A2T0FDX6_9ASCO|nr:Quinone oxidoreductase PIG3 [Wickerhamiella sorbophila]PRT53139.1 Quinone oxidoreductase PIG3 [Wickerhamiella sorbophila]